MIKLIAIDRIVESCNVIDRYPATQLVTSLTGPDTSSFGYCHLRSYCQMHLHPSDYSHGGQIFASRVVSGNLAADVVDPLARTLPYSAAECAIPVFSQSSLYVSTEWIAALWTDALRSILYLHI